MWRATAGEEECLFLPCSFLEPTAGEAVEVTPWGVVGKVKRKLQPCGLPFPFEFSGGCGAVANQAQATRVP